LVNPLGVMVNNLSSLFCNTVFIYILLKHKIQIAVKIGKMGCICVVEYSLHAPC
jgi:hypothetical protein